MNKLPYIRILSKNHPLIVVALSSVIIIASLIIIFRAEFDTDVTRLIPQNAEKTSLYFNIMEKSGNMEKVYIIFSSNRIMDYAQVIDSIGNEIYSSGFASKVDWKISEETKTFLKQVYAKKFPLLLSENDMNEFIYRLSPEGMTRELKKTMLRLAIPGGQEYLAVIDPLNFFELFSAHMRLSDVSFDPGSGYFITPDGKSIILIITPKKSPRNIAFSKKLINDIENILKKHSRPELKTEVTGSHAITLHEASVMKSEIFNNIFMSIISVMLIFYVFFRSLKGLFYVILPVLLSIIATLGITLLFLGSLSEITGAFAGLIVGLGIDLGIVLYVRYLINLKSYTDKIECMDKSITSVYRGINTGVITTALIFFPMIFSSFKGIRELGILTGTGMLICWAFLFGLTSTIIKPSSSKFFEIRSIQKLAVFSYKKPYAVIWLTSAITLFLIFFIPRIHVIGDITKLGTVNNHAKLILENLQQNYLNVHRIFITDVSKDMESALIRSLEIKNAVSHDLKNVYTAGDILPPIASQENNIKILSAVNSRKIIDNFNKKASEAGFRTKNFKRFTNGLKNMIENREPLTIKDLEPIKELLERLLIKENNGWRIIVAGNPKDNSSLKTLNSFSYTGTQFIRHELLGILKKDAIIITLTGLFLVNIILYLDFKKLFYVFLCQLPVFISIIWVLGIMGLFNISLNFMNALVFVMLVGIGSDYTVHLLHHYLSNRDIASTFLQTGKAVLVAGLTTIAGFGSIGFSSYKGLATMGQVAAIGTGLCVILSLCLIPSLLKLHEKSSHRQ